MFTYQQQQRQNNLSFFCYCRFIEYVTSTFWYEAKVIFCKMSNNPYLDDDFLWHCIWLVIYFKKAQNTRLAIPRKVVCMKKIFKMFFCFVIEILYRPICNSKIIFLKISLLVRIHISIRYHLFNCLSNVWITSLPMLTESGVIFAPHFWGSAIRLISYCKNKHVTWKYCIIPKKDRCIIC